jgi:hypothetical protein
MAIYVSFRSDRKQVDGWIAAQEAARFAERS